MITASYLTDTYSIRKEFLEDGFYSVSLGAIDAPNSLAAGSYLRVKAVTIPDYEYALPYAISRDA